MKKKLQLDANTRQPLFLAWKNFQRRAELLGSMLDAEVVYCNYYWEERSKLHKALSYFGKAVSSIKILVRHRPELLIVQLPTTPLLYIAVAYSYIFGAQVVSDCHNDMIQGKWLSWPLAKRLLRKTIVVVHNQFVLSEAHKKIGFKPFVLRDGFENRQGTSSSEVLDKFGLATGEYVIMPWNFNKDEPLEEAIAAAALMPEKKFVMTWHWIKISALLRSNMPSNIILTGYLPNEEFISLFSHAGVALVLTNREGTQLSGMAEAIAFGVPAVISDLKSTRGLYEDAACYVHNQPQPIVDGIRKAFYWADEMRVRMAIVRKKTECEIDRQLSILKQAITQ